MSTHNIQFHDKIRIFTLIFVFWTYRKNFIGTQKRVRMIHGKRAIGVRDIEVLLYLKLYNRRHSTFSYFPEEKKRFR